MENCVNVPVSLNMCGDTGLSGAGCGSSASPVLRRGLLGRLGRSTHPNPLEDCAAEYPVQAHQCFTVVGILFGRIVERSFRNYMHNV